MASKKTAVKSVSKAKVVKKQKATRKKLDSSSARKNAAEAKAEPEAEDIEQDDELDFDDYIKRAEWGDLLECSKFFEIFILRASIGIQRLYKGTFDPYCDE